MTLLESTPPELLVSYPVYDRGESFPFPSAHPNLREMLHGVKGSARRVTLLGDAAHPMSPFKAQGANQALSDAVHLADALDMANFAQAPPIDCSTSKPDASSPEALLREFERQMFERSEPQRLRSRAAVNDLHSEDIRIAAATGKDGSPSADLAAEYQRVRIGCWDAAVAPETAKAVRRFRSRLDEKIVEAGKATRRREARQRVRSRKAKRSTVQGS